MAETAPKNNSGREKAPDPLKAQKFDISEIDFGKERIKYPKKLLRDALRPPVDVKPKKGEQAPTKSEVVASRLKSSLDQAAAIREIADSGKGDDLKKFFEKSEFLAAGSAIEMDPAKIEDSHKQIFETLSGDDLWDLVNDESKILVIVGKADSLQLETKSVVNMLEGSVARGFIDKEQAAEFAGDKLSEGDLSRLEAIQAVAGGFAENQKLDLKTMLEESTESDRAQMDDIDKLIAQYRKVENEYGEAVGESEMEDYAANFVREKLGGETEEGDAEPGTLFADYINKFESPADDQKILAKEFRRRFIENAIQKGAKSK